MSCCIGQSFTGERLLDNMQKAEKGEKGYMGKNSCQRLIFICILFLMTLFMMFYVITGVMLPYLTAYYGLTITQSGMVSSFQYGGETMILFVSGLIAHKMEKVKMIAGCFIGTAAALAGISLHLPFLFLLSLFLLLGICSGLFTYYATSLIAQLYPENRSRYMTILYIGTSIGCMAAPHYPTRQLDMGREWWRIYRTDAAIILVSTVVFLGILFCLRKNLREAKSQKDAVSEVRLPPLRFLFQKGSGKLGILCLMALVYMGHQISLTTWLPTYLAQELKMTSAFTGVALSVFASGLLIGRIVYTLLAGRISAEGFLLFTSTLGGIILGAGLMIGSKGAILTAMVLTGILTGAINPVLTGLSCDWYPQNTDAAAGLICLSLSVGGMAFPFIVGVIAERISFFAAIFTAALDLLLIALLLVMVMVREHTNPK